MESVEGIIYNVTVQVNTGIADAWLQWLKEEHIPEMIATGCFTHATILRLIEIDETPGPTYAIQYHATGKALYNRYIEIFAETMRKKSFEKWDDQFIAFRSVLRVVN
jgi:hypothetical protein